MSKKLPVIKFKAFQAMLEEKGFSLREVTATHYIYTDKDDYQVVLPYSGKEVEPIMAKVILNRMKRGQLRKYQPTTITRTKG